MRKAAYCNYFFIPNLRSYTKNIDIVSLLETNYKLENINGSFKIAYYKLSCIFNCLKKIQKHEFFLKIDIFIFLILLVKNSKNQMHSIIQNINLRNSVIKKFLISKTKESAILFFG